MKIYDKDIQEKLMIKVMKEVDKAVKEGNNPFASFLVDYDGIYYLFVALLFALF